MSLGSSPPTWEPKDSTPDERENIPGKFSPKPEEENYVNSEKKTQNNNNLNNKINNNNLQIIII
jgi:hypothetical protein